MLQFYTSLADRLYVHRWWFGGTTAAVFVLLLFLVLTRTAEMPIVALSVPLIAVSWGLLCMCVWFHPTSGRLYSGPLFNRLPRILKTAIRWYGAVFLTLWFVFGVLVWPAFVLFGDRLIAAPGLRGTKSDIEAAMVLNAWIVAGYTPSPMPPLTRRLAE